MRTCHLRILDVLADGVSSMLQPQWFWRCRPHVHLPKASRHPSPPWRGWHVLNLSCLPILSSSPGKCAKLSNFLYKPFEHLAKKRSCKSGARNKGLPFVEILKAQPTGPHSNQPQTNVGTWHEQLWPCVLWQFAPEALPAVPVGQGPRRLSSVSMHKQVAFLFMNS